MKGLQRLESMFASRRYEGLQNGKILFRKNSYFNYYCRRTNSPQRSSTRSPNIKKIKKNVKTFQTSSTPTRPDRPKSDVETRSRSSPLPGPAHADAASSTRGSRGGSPNGFTLGHRGHSSHQQGWRFCGSFKELNGGTSTLK